MSLVYLEFAFIDVLFFYNLLTYAVFLKILINVIYVYFPFIVGRTQPNLDDLGLTFRHMGINIGELEDYVRHVDPVPFAHEVVAFPAPKTNNLQFPNPNSREILHHREEHIHEHLPHMFPGMEGGWYNGSPDEDCPDEDERW